MLIQKLRLKQGWSQQQLAEASGLSTRTIQRIETGHPASVETLKPSGAVFEVDFASLSPTPPESPTMSVSPTARTAACSMPSLMRRALTAQAPRPMPGKT